MDRIDFYLDVVPLPVVVAAALGVILAFLAIPARMRLVVALVALPVWLTIAQLPGLGLIQAVAKVSSSMGYMLVAIAAMLHPGPRRRLPAILWLYPVMACVAFVYVLGVEDRFLAMALRIQWLMLTVAAVMLARTLVTGEDVHRVVYALALGCVLAIGLPLSGLILFPGEAFLKGMNRFQPYGVNSNQIGVLFALTVPLAVYTALSRRGAFGRPVLLFAAAVTLGMALITGSRQTILAICIVMIPLLLRFTRRPVVTLLAAGIVAGGLSWLLGMAEIDALRRFTSLESGRVEIWLAYLPVLRERLYFGLGGTTGFSFLKDMSVGMHTHNAYLDMLHLGGLSFFVPMMILAVYSAFCTWRVWRVRRHLGVDPLLISLLAVLLMTMYFQGLFNQVVYWPTYSWSFLHVILACLFVGVAADLRRGQPAFLDPADEEPWDEDELEDSGGLQVA
jgi:hypothetical protein